MTTTEHTIIIIGSGPSAIFLGALLSGHVPTQDLPFFSKAHWPSKIVRKKSAVQFIEKPTCVKLYILGDHLGGMWSEDDETETISYGWQLEIPQYPLEVYLKDINMVVNDYDYYRPTRSLMAKYYQYVEKKLNLQFILCDVYKVVKQSTQPFFKIFSNKSTMEANQVVFATGKYTMPKSLSFDSNYHIPTSIPSPAIQKVLIIGSGFSAADAVLQYLKWNVQVYHCFYAFPEHQHTFLSNCHDAVIFKPSPLLFCHASSYPRYAQLFQSMKNATYLPGDTLHVMKEPYVPLPGYQAISPNQLLDPWGNTHDIVVDQHHTLIGYHDLGFCVDKNTIYLRKSPSFFKHPLVKHLSINHVFVCGSAAGATLICDCFESCYQVYKDIKYKQ